MLCTIWYHLYHLKNVKNTHGGALLLKKLQAEACNFTKSNARPCLFFTFLKLHKWYQIAHRITYAKNVYKFNDYLQFQEATNLVSKVIANRKQDYHGNVALNRNNPETSTKTYWSILKTFYNSKKISVICPLIINNKLVSNFKRRKQITLIVFCFPLHPVRQQQ